MSELTPEEFTKDFTKYSQGKILIGLLLVFAVIMVGTGIYWSRKHNQRTDEFISREINGILIKSEEATRGMQNIKIRQHTSGEELTHSLSFSADFFRENNIQPGDSIAKEANSHTISFFKKDNGEFRKCCDLIYP